METNNINNGDYCALKSLCQIKRKLTNRMEYDGMTVSLSRKKFYDEEQLSFIYFLFSLLYITVAKFQMI